MTNPDPTRVYCEACAFYDAEMPDGEGNCHHPNARTVVETYERRRVVWVPAGVRNGNNDCPDFVLTGSRWLRRFRSHPIAALWPWVVLLAWTIVALWLWHHWPLARP